MYTSGTARDLISRIITHHIICMRRSTEDVQISVEAVSTLQLSLFMSTTNWQQFCLIAVLCGVVFDVGYLRLQRKKRALPLPPGPPPLPVVGNVRGINTSSPWLTYTEWAHVYGTSSLYI